MFNYAQTFYLDPDVVKKAPEVAITKIDLFFRAKPKATGNKSGILNPGVQISIVECLMGIPNIAEIGTIRPQEPTEHGARFSPRYEFARVEYGSITASRDASIATSFKFKNPVLVRSGYEYAILVKFDGNEDFVLWWSKQNDLIVNTTTPAPGPNGKYIGSLFSYISPINSVANPGNTNYGYTNTNVGNTASSTALLNTATNSAPPKITPTLEYLMTNWRPIPETDLKFNVYVARYFHNLSPVSANATIQNDVSATGYTPANYSANSVANGVFILPAPQRAMEYFSYDKRFSKIENLNFGELAFQTQPYYPGGTASPLTVTVYDGDQIYPQVVGAPNPTRVIANGNWTFSNGVTFNNAGGWNTIFSLIADEPEYIIIDNGNEVNARRIQAIESNTVLVIQDVTTFTNTAARFFVSPVGQIWSTDETLFGNKVSGFVSLVQSNANSSVRFVNSRIESISIANSGTGYSNSMYIKIGNTAGALNAKGFEYVVREFEGGYEATANIVTNSTGNVVAIFVKNTGCNFTNTAWLTGSNVHIVNSSGLAVPTSTANGLVMNFNIGSTVRTEFYANNIFANAQFINLEVARMKPEITVNNPLGTVFNIKHRSQYGVKDSANTSNKKQYILTPNNREADIDVKIFKSHAFLPNSAPVLTSRSNEYVIRTATGAVGNDAVVGQVYSNSTAYMFEISSNNDFTLPFFEPEIINAHYSRYIINNDYTDEHTNYGNAVAKHIGTKVNFSQDRLAEDLLVYLTAYRPVGTNIKVLARIHNSKDPEAFDDKDWTLMEEIDGIGVFSSIEDSSDFIEITYGFTQSPNTIQLSGTARIAGANTSLVSGTDATFSTANLAANSIVKVSTAIDFSGGNTFFVGVVNTVINATAFTLQDPVTNNSFLDTNLRLGKVLFPRQAFNNIQNDYVVRYYNEEQMEYDGYNTFQVKIVMLSNNSFIVPKIDDVRAIGVTA